MPHPAKGRPILARSIVLVVAALVVGVGVASILYTLRDEPPRRPSGMLPPLVESIVVQAEDVVERFVGYGTAIPDRTVNLASEVAATVVERVNDIETGSIVAEHQVLLRFDERQYVHALERALALAAGDQAAIEESAVEAARLQELIRTTEHELQVARDERKRLADLFERGLAASKEFDFANLAYQRARRVLQGFEMQLAKNAPRRDGFIAARRSHEAEAAAARLDIERCAITAPFGGAIQAINVDVGDRVGPGTVVITLIAPSRVEIPIRLPAAVYTLVRIGAPCHVASESMPGTSWQGEVARVAPSVDRQTRTFAVYVDVDNTIQPQPLVPGTFVRAEVDGPTHHDRLLVPRGAIRDGHVLIAHKGRAYRRSVSIERLIEDRALILGELHSGERVILSHLTRLTDQAPVRVRTALSASPAPANPSAYERPSASP